jgi:hypothetical protein
VGTLLGDADVWDDTPARPRPLRRGLAALSAGLAVGLAVGWAVAPRPAPPAPVVSLPAPRSATPAPAQGGPLVEQAMRAGPMLVAGPGRLEEVRPDGSGERVVGAGFPAVAVLPARGRSPLVALGGDAVVAIDRSGASRTLTPDGFRARGVAGRGGKVLACGRRPLPLDQRQAAIAAGRDETRSAPALLLGADGGKATEVAMACPVAWAAGSDVVAGAGGAQVPFQRTTRGTSVLAGRPGGPLATLLTRARLEQAAGAGASVGAVAVSPDGRLVAVAAGATGGPWALLLAPVRGGPVRRVAVADGYEVAWLGFEGGQGRLALVAVDRRGGLAEQSLATRAGGGYVLGYDPASHMAGVLLAGAALERADGFGFSPDGLVFAVSSPRGWTMISTTQPADRAVAPVGGTLLAWPGTGR